MARYKLNSYLCFKLPTANNLSTEVHPTQNAHKWQVSGLRAVNKSEQSLKISIPK